jgi:hypothetical protein
MQPILDHHAAVNYMVKYATKSEKPGTNFTQVMKDVIGQSTEEDDPQSKIRSVMLKSIGGKRDLGQCEISRLLLSEPMYHSSFNYVTLSTDLYTKEVNTTDQALKKNIIDFYADRFQNSKLQNSLDDVNNLMQFVQKFIVKNSELALRQNPEKIVVIAYPKVRHCPNDPVKFAQFCYHQSIKYTPWTRENFNEISNVDTAIERWHNFLTTAPAHILESLKFNTELAKQLRDSRNEIDVDVSEPQPILSRDNWMLLAEIRPNDDDDDIDHDQILIDANYDWLQHSNNYSNEEVSLMKNWIEQQKITNNSVNENELPTVLPSQLNTMQKFAYNVIKKLNEEKKTVTIRNKWYGWNR